ncbi:MAG: YARHG domain-containing protein [Lachnospiraceae bacterium]|nr:YARHG domain-containing protein [Lachnospiraceae bacterium]
MTQKNRTSITIINKTLAILGLSLLISLTLVSGCGNVSETKEDGQIQTSGTVPVTNSHNDHSQSQDTIAPSSLEAPVSSEDKTNSSDLNSTMEQNKESKKANEYILPESNAKYLSEEELKNISKEELKIARNEIYARHGRKFQSQDLQKYFESKTWYRGTVDPANFSESLLNDYEKKNVQLIQRLEETAQSFPELSSLFDAPSKEIIDRYGYENGYSVLSFHIKENSLEDCGEYYQVDATYQQRIEAPADLQEGEQITLTFNELTGETRTLIFRKNHFYPLDSTNYYDGFYYYPSSDGKSFILYHDSEDRMDKPVFEGKLCIRKDATEEVDIIRQIQPVTKELLNRESWYNGVYFDQKGYVTRLVYYGD